MFPSGLREIGVHSRAFALRTNQNLTIAGVSASWRGQIKALLRKHRIENDVRSTGLRRSSMACVALPTCGLTMAEGERYFPRLIDRLDAPVREAGLARDSISIRMPLLPRYAAEHESGESIGDFVVRPPNAISLLDAVVNPGQIPPYHWNPKSATKLPVPSPT